MTRMAKTKQPLSLLVVGVPCNCGTWQFSNRPGLYTRLYIVSRNMTSNYSKYWQRFVLIIGVTVFINVMYFIYNGNNLFSANDRIRQMTMEDSGDSSKVALPEEHSNSNATKPVKNAGCVSKRVFTKGLPATALASFPGSGNTWVRYLLEQSTGECQRKSLAKSLNWCGNDKSL